MATQSALDTNTTMQTPQQQPGNLVPMEAHPLQTGVPGRLYSPHDRVGPILDAMAAFHRGFTRQDMYAVYKAGGTRAVDAVLSNEELLKNKYPVKQVIDGIRGGHTVLRAGLNSPRAARFHAVRARAHPSVASKRR